MDKQYLCACRIRFFLPQGIAEDVSFGEIHPYLARVEQC